MGRRRRSIKIENENSDKGYTLEVDIEYPKNLYKLHSDLPFLPERMEIEKFYEDVCTVYNKKKCYSHKCIKTSVKSQINTKKKHGVIQFNQEAWLKPYIDMNNDIRKKAKNDFFKLMNNSVYGKTMQNVRNHRYINTVTTNKKWIIKNGSQINKKW